MAAASVPVALGWLLLLALLPRGLLFSTPPSPPPWSGPHIADLNVLLPPRMTNPVQYRLIASGGCFIWTWDHHDILSVQPEYNGSDGCSTSARLTSIGSYSGRKETAVYASDINSQNVLRCEVFIDKIVRIQIFHHSVKLDLDGLATLHVRAFDNKDNIFSSLVGLRFKWNLIPKSTDGVPALHRLIHVPIKETPLSDCGGFCGDLDTQVKLEDSGIGSDLYVVRGIEIGQEIVTAQLLEPEVGNVMDEIVLTVAELMSLEPSSPILVIIGASFQYNLRVIRQNTPKVISLPSLHHCWSSSNITVATVDSLMGNISAFDLGATNVVVEDTRVSGHIQISTLYVVVPDRLSLHIMPVTLTLDPLKELSEYSPRETWYIIAGQLYVVHVKAFSSKLVDKEIYLTENNRYVLESSSLSHWNLSFISDDVARKYGWRNSMLLYPVSEGQETLIASLTYRKESSGMDEAIKIEQLVHICNRVTLHTEKTYSLGVIQLPWVPGAHQEMHLTARGGCATTTKEYKWVSSNPATLSVTSSGVVCAKHPGRAVVKVTSIYDELNYSEVVFEVSTPSSLVMLQEFLVETRVGGTLQAAVAMKGSNGEYYDKCDRFSSLIKWSVTREKECFKILNADRLKDENSAAHLFSSRSLSNSICALIEISLSCSGHATLVATFPNESLPSDLFWDRKIVLQASKLIGAYAPLSAKQAGNGNQYGGYWVDLDRSLTADSDYSTASLTELYLVPGTTMDVMLLGGPEKWSKDVEYIDNVIVTNEDNVHFVDEIVLNKGPSGGGMRLYTLSCHAIGQFRLQFSRGNLGGSGHLTQTVESLNVSLICGFPNVITVIANEPANTPDVIRIAVQEPRNRENVRLSPISVANAQRIRLAAVGIHDSGNAFANSSSLCLKWDLVECEKLAVWDAAASFETSSTGWDRFLLLHNTSGECIVRATVIGFVESIFRHIGEKAQMTYQDDLRRVNDAIKLQLVTMLAIEPDYVVLVYAPEAKINMSIVGGTCYLDAVVNDTYVADITHHPVTEQCSWLTLHVRGLGWTHLIVYDKGLSPPAAATARVKVANVEWIKVISDDELFLLEGTTQSLKISAGTLDGEIFDSSQFFYMNIHVHVDENILEVINGDGMKKSGHWRVYHPSFDVRAVNIGVATLHVRARTQSGSWIFSQQITVEVYGALKIHPAYIFLSPGASYMVNVEGGPIGEVFVEYSIQHDGYATINRSSGLLSALSIGNTSVYVASYTSDGRLICQAVGSVEVGIPPSMILNMQSEKLCVGCQMPIFPSYPQGNLFSFYELCKEYAWSIEDQSVLDLFSIYRHVDKFGIHPSCIKDVNTQVGLDSSDNGFIRTLYGRSPGRTLVSVTFSCDFKLPGKVMTSVYKASQTVTVISDPPLALGIPITWVLPPHYTTLDILPDLFETYGKQEHHHRKRGIVYSLLTSREKNNIREDPIALIGSKIRTGEYNNLGCLQAKDHTGRTEIASCVRVTKVAQVRLSTKDTPSYVVHLGVSDNLDLIIDYCDDLGYHFLEAHGAVPLEFETNYHDVVSIYKPSSNGGNQSKPLIYLQGKRQGKALVKVSIKDGVPQKATYILVLVGAQLLPRNPILHVGNIVNFTVFGEGISSTLPGFWRSTNESVLLVDRLTGQAHARVVGDTKVFFESASMNLWTTVEVSKNEQILVHSPVETLTNVPLSSEGYPFSVKFSETLTRKHSATGSSSEAAYDCLVDPPYIGYAKPWRDQTTGISYCLFFPYSPQHIASLVSKSNIARSRLPSRDAGLLYVSIIASLKEAKHIMGSAHVLFVGGFSVSAVDGTAISQLNLTTDSNRTVIVVTGNTDVQVLWGSKDWLMVRSFHKDDFSIAGKATYEVEALKNRRFTDKISIVLPATGQREVIGVEYNPEGNGAPAGSSTAFWTAVALSIVLLLFTVIIFVKLLEKPDSSRTSSSRHPVPSPAAHATPVQSRHSPTTPAGTSTPSPSRTPPGPMLDYVRRTIDETPYYKRDGRRRFDPQYTY